MIERTPERVIEDACHEITIVSDILKAIANGQIGGSQVIDGCGIDYLASRINLAVEAIEEVQSQVSRAAGGRG